MHRPSSSHSEYSATSSAAPGSRRPRAVPGGPRKPSTKASLSSMSILSQAHRQPHSQPQQQQHQHQQQQQQGQRQHRQSQNELPPSYVQSQHDVQAHTHIHTQTQRPPQSYTPPPTSAVASDSSCSHPPMSIFTRADTPSSMSAFSPIRTMSPTPVLEPHAEEAPERHSARQALRPPLADVTPKGEPRTQSSPISNPGIPLKPPTPSPESPVSTLASASAYTKPRKMGPLAPQPLQPPPSVDFSSVPISWKALTLDAAQWTFSSAELQAIVSGAIRASAEPTSIRLLPLQTLNEDLNQELERLESERAQARAQYRFTMHRRTMLLQSLNASSGSSNSPSSATSFSTSTINLSHAPTPSPVADLAQRLAEVSITLDRLAETLVRVSDQLAQIRSLQDVHAASALAVALRKLNASYARRTREVQSLKEKLETTEAERDEAWRVAEELATEYDHDEELGEVVQGDVVNGERAVATFTRASTAGVTIKIPGVGPRVRHSEDEAEMDSPGEPGDESTIVPRRRRANSATSRVSAARTRSIRTSKASLRFPRSHESRPPSSYSQHSAHSGPSRARSRSRAGSTVGSPIDAPTPDVPNAPNEAIPDVPKIPNAVELARLVSVKSTASAPSAGATRSSTLLPMPPPPIETSPTKTGSFLDMVTRPNSAMDVKGKSPEKANADADTEAGAGDTESNAQDDETLRSGGAQANGAEAVANGHVDGDEQPINDEAGITPEKRDEEVDEAQIINVPPGLQIHHHIPHSASRVEASSTTELSEEVAIAKKQMQTRPSLHIYPAGWTRPPPDSPVDVSRRSDPHHADDDEDDLTDEAELADAFETAYAQTQTRGLATYRSPLRVQHAQSLLPFPGAENRGRASFLGTTNIRPAYAEGMKRSPASDNIIERRGPFLGAAVSASARRPTSLPSAQGEKPWNYF